MNKDTSSEYGKVIAKAWSDNTYKRRLMDDPNSALAEVGVTIPSGTSIRVVENTPNTIHLVLPPQPPKSQLSDDVLDKLASGGGLHINFNKVCLCGEIDFDSIDHGLKTKAYRSEGVF